MKKPLLLPNSEPSALNVFSVKTAFAALDVHPGCADIEVTISIKLIKILILFIVLIILLRY
jgi:hypothetical protein